MISRDQATKIVSDEAQAKGFNIKPTRTLSPSEITERMPLIYGLDISNCWIVYVETSGVVRIQASTIAVIDRSAGQLLYWGSAGDEG